MTNGCVQFPQVVTGYRRVHMVFDVVVHVPVEESDERCEDHGSGVQTEIVNVVLEPDMLRVVAEE